MFQFIKKMFKNYKSAPKKATKPAPETVIKPAPKKAAKSPPETVIKPAPKKAAKSSPETVVKLAPKKATKPAPETVIKPTPEKATKPAPQAYGKHIIIGLDFGTSSTKILVRKRGEQKARIVQIEESTEDYPWFVTPSLIRSSEGKLFFGKCASEYPNGTLYRSLKVQLLPPVVNSSAVQKFPEGESPDNLVSCYLSWVLNNIKNQFGVIDSNRVYLNMSAPMNHIENDELKTRYLKIIQAAWESVFGKNPFPVEQGMSLIKLSSRFNEWLEMDVPDTSVRRFEVLPETTAPIVSLSMDPRMDPGMYMIVDMGAGTTEISINNVNDSGAYQRVNCYDDESIFLGGDDFNWVDDQARNGNEHTPEKLQYLTDFFLKTFKIVWARGYQKDCQSHSNRHGWKKLKVLLTGGGSRRTEIINEIERGNVGRDGRIIYPWPSSETHYRVSNYTPTELETSKEAVNYSTKDFPLLAVAHGLSVERMRWPKIHYPKDIEPLQPIVIKEKPSIDWYLVK